MAEHRLIAVRMPAQLLAELEAEATLNERSLSAEIRYRLKLSLEKNTEVVQALEHWRKPENLAELKRRLNRHGT